MSDYAINLADIEDAAHRIGPFIRRTPLMTSSSVDREAGRNVFLKCENFQRVGAFKFRGATNAVQKLEAVDAARGVVTHSSGNHAQALALAARIRGIDAHIVMPINAPQVKRDAVVDFGATIYDCGPTQEARERMADEVVARTGGILIPPFDHPDVLAGQGTIGLELPTQEPVLDAVIVPIGGGGLISGITLALREIAPGIKVIAAEPAGADDAFRSKRDGARVTEQAPETIADGLRTCIGELTWPVLRDLVDQVITVSDDEIRIAMRLLYSRVKLVVEPSAAVGLAVACSPELAGLSGLGRVAVVLTGGNVDLGALHDLLT
jgi:threonine dehydratase/serine racemase